MAEDFGFKPEDTGNEFGFKPELQAPQAQTPIGTPQVPQNEQMANDFEAMPAYERAVKGATGAIESYGRGAANLVTGTLGQGLGSVFKGGIAKAAGLSNQEAMEEGQKGGEELAKALHLNPVQKSSAYFDKEIAEGLEFARTWVGEHATKAKSLDQATLESLKDEAANRGIAEGVFDNVIVPAILGKMVPNLRRGGKSEVKGEEPIAKGPEGAQGEFGFKETSNVPPTMEGQPNRSPYNLPPEEIDRLGRELNPPTERRANDQGELFTDYNPTEKFNVEPPQGGGRFRASEMNKQVGHDVESDRGLGGATEMSNLSADLFGPKESHLGESVPFEPSPPHGQGELTLVRHGDTVLNDKNKLRAWDDSPDAQLNEKGKDDAAKLGAKHSNDDFTHIYTSDLGRAQETTNALNKNQAPVTPLEGLRPWGAGDWTGKDADKYGAEMAKMAENEPDKPIPGGGESFNQFKNRVLGTIKGILDSHPGEKVAIVTHHRVERLFKAWKKVGMPDDFSIDMKTFKDWEKGTKPGKSENIKLGSKGPMGKQRGTMDMDLLTIGVRNLLDSRGFKAVMEKFRGTFSDVAVDHALKQSEDPTSRETIIFMTPDRFHELARDRERNLKEQIANSAFPEKEADIRSRDAKYAERLRESIREGIDKKGLNQLPELVLDQENHFAPGAAVHSVVAHEGRHRADVFKEKGLDLMPVRVTHSTMRWGEAHAEDFPRRVISENGKFVDFPQPENWKGVENDLDFTKMPLSNKGPMGRQRGTIDFGIFKKNSDKDVAKKGFIPALLDARKQFQMEKRDLPTLMKEEGINVNTIKDIGDTFAAGTKALTDRTVAILSEANKDVGKMLKWAIDKMNVSDDKQGLNTEKDLYGEKYKGGTGSITRPFETRVRSEEGILTLWKDAHKTTEGKLQLRAMLTKATDNIGKDLTRGDFASDQQHKIYQAVQRGLTSVLDRVNEARAKIGMKPIERLPGFLPASWEGDYRVHVFDGLDNKKMSFGFSNVYQAKLAFKALKEEHPDLTIKDPVHVSIDKTKIGDLSAFEEAIRALGKDDPTSLALQRTMVQLRSTKGFGRHGLQRKGVLGFLGMEEGDTGVRNMETSLEQYVRQANRYISNMEKAQAASQLDNLPLKIQQQIPNALQYMRDYIDQSRGADLDKMPFVKDFFGGLSKLGGFGESAPMHVLRQLSSLSSMFMLFTPRFILSQTVQHTNAIAKYVQLNHEGTFKNPIIAYWKGLEHFVKPDEEAINGANWAQRNGKLDSAIVAMLEMKLGDVAFERSKIIKDGVSVFMGQLEKKAVRLPTFLAFEYGLRDSIKDPNLRYETAANMMDHYMVHYSKTARPMMYSKMGMVGEAASQFKQYSHNGFGQFFEYLQYAQKQGGSIGPLATHIGMQIAVGGLKGTIMVAEASAAISAINYVLAKSGSNTQIPDLQDLLMNSNLHDLLVFGGLSTVLNSDVSSSVNAPNVPQMFSAPSIQFGAKAAADSANYLMKKLAGEDTEADQMRALLSVTPSAMRGWIEELYSKPGQPVPKPGQGMKGDYVRSDDEKTKAKLFSLKSLNEARMNALANSTRKELAKDANSKISELDAIVDHVQAGRPVDPAVMQRFIKNGGDVNHLSDIIVKRMMERSMDYANREVYNKQLTPAQIHKLETMKQVLDEEYRQKQQSEYQRQSGEVQPQIGEDKSGPAEIRRRQNLINSQMDKKANERFNPVINEMSDKQKDEFYYKKEQERMRQQRGRKVEM